MAMVTSQLTGKNITPDKLSSYAASSGYRDANGTNSKFIESASNKFGLSDKRLAPSSSNIINELNHGNPVILNGMSNGNSNSPYTKRGHYVVAVGTDKNGNIVVNDPRGANYSGSVSPDVIDSESRAAWSFRNRSISGGSDVGKGVSTAYKVGRVLGKTPVGKKVINKLKDAGLSFARKKPIGFGDETNVQRAQRAVYAWMLAVEKKNKYSNTNRSDADATKGLTGTGSGDCSSHVRWAYHKALGKDFDFGDYTGSQYNSTSIPKTIDIYPQSNGMLDISKLQCGDLIFFTDGKTNVCHVEMYCGDGTTDNVIGHGGPQGAYGPFRGSIAGNLKYFKKLGGGIVKARRFINESSISGRTIYFPNGNESATPLSTKNGDATVDSSVPTNILGDIDTSNPDFLGTFTTSLSTAFDKIASAGNNYIYGNDDAFAETENNKTVVSGPDASFQNGAVVSRTDQTDRDAVKKAVWKYFRTAGFSDVATAGIMGNIEAESGFNPSNQQITSGDKPAAAGLFQWEDYKHPSKDTRFRNLSNLAAERNTTWEDLQTQLDYANLELNNTLDTYFDKAVSYPNEGISLDPTNLSNFKKETSISQATLQFMKAFERPSKPHVSNRLSYAQKHYDEFKDADYSGWGDDVSLVNNNLKPTDDLYRAINDDKIQGYGGDSTKFTSTKTNALRNESRSSEITNKITNQNQINKLVDTSKMERLINDAIVVLKSINNNTNDSVKKLDKIKNNNIIVAGNNAGANSNNEAISAKSDNISNIKSGAGNRNFDLASRIALG